MFDFLRRIFGPSGAQSGTLTREYNTTIAGIDHAANGVALVRQLRVGDRLRLLREPENPHDKNALAVVNAEGQRLGYIPARIAADVSRALDDDGGKIGPVKVMEKTAEGRDQKRFNAVVQFHLTRQRRRTSPRH